MKLKALRVHGFKSFADTTEIEFHAGITAVVGPNGCGKSNISDAIRWVLGEQRPTAIRGAKMEEAIFQGSVNRRPVNRGSVSLVVSNEDGSLPVPFEEVELGRTVYRDGGSDYSINRTSCRLRDVLDLCRDTGLGANAYAIIENRMIDAILSDRAEERRSLFEEAAGIGKYKDRRKAALRRLERAEVDLQRLDDVIAEVESKVRSLARQKGKAQRFQSLRDRRLAVEVAVVRHQIGKVKGRLEELLRELAGDRELGEGFLAELRAAETQHETLRIRQVEVEKARGESAGVLDRVRQELVRWERELAVAEERGGYARRRLTQIGEEREELGVLVERLEVDRTALEIGEAELARELEGLVAEREIREGTAREARASLESVRGEMGEVESMLRDLTRRLAQLEGEAASAESQGVELGKHLERLQREIEEAAHALTDVASQGDLFADRLVGLERRVEEARERLEAVKGDGHARREAMDAVRREEAEARDRVASLQARVEALEAMERGQEGMEPTVKAALALADPGVVGTLGEFLEGEPPVVRGVEAFLGPLVQGLVVRDRDTVARLHAWYGKEWGGRGGLLLLPLDGVDDEWAEGSLLRSLRLRGEGAPWVRKLLSGIELDEDGLPGAAKGSRLSLRGITVDSQGIVRLGTPLGSSGMLERREKIKRLHTELSAALESQEAASRQRVEGELALRGAEEALEEAWSLLREAEDAQRSAAAEVQAQTDRRARLDRHQEELARQIEGTRAARARALDRAQSAREDREILTGELEGLRGREEDLRVRVTQAQEAWEAARSEEAQLALEVARREGERTRMLERIRDLASTLSGTRARLGSLAGEEETLRQEEEAAARLREDGAGATELLFRERESAEEELRRREEAVAIVSEALTEAERRVRSARSAEREAVDRRHSLEMEQKELEGRLARIQDRLEAEWGRSLKALFAEAEPVDGEPEQLQEELREIVEKLEKLGPVNMLAVEEHQEESARLEFLLGQRDDLRSARSDLRAAIRQINETATQLFQESFQKIRENFRTTFMRLFEGGEADLWLEEGADPLEAAVEIHASPRGKKTQRIDLLSGGERALTALSLLFGIYLVKPSPFCVMDEVDAPLDESNIYRFIRLLQEFKGQTQFIVITHNARTIEAADWIYGVTMEEPGVSRIVGVRLEDALQASGSAA